MSYNAYIPDAWVIVKIITPVETLYKLLSGWYGGYTGSNEWRLNSGITKYQDNGDHYIFYGYSGSAYTCYKPIERFTSYTQQIFNNLLDSAENKSNIKVEHISMEQFIEEFKENESVI